MRKLLLFVGVLLTLGIVVYAQQAGSLAWNSNGSVTTINAPTSSGTTYTFNMPNKTGVQTFAMLSDITAGPTPTPTPVPTPTPTPATPQYFGTITLANGVGTVTFATAVSGCRVTDRSGNSVKYGPTVNATIWQFSGVGPTLDYECR